MIKVVVAKTIIKMVMIISITSSCAAALAHWLARHVDGLNFSLFWSAREEPISDCGRYSQRGSIAFKWQTETKKRSADSTCSFSPRTSRCLLTRFSPMLILALFVFFLLATCWLCVFLFLFVSSRFCLSCLMGQISQTFTLAWSARTCCRLTQLADSC